MKKSNKASLSSYGARIQFEIAIVLISILPLLTLGYLVYSGTLIDKSGGRFTFLIAPILLVLVALGYVLLSKYPSTIIKLRNLLENMVEKEIPIKVELSQSENDIRTIEKYMNVIIGQLKERINTMEQEKGQLEKQLTQAQKLKSVDTLASGIAHEINTPIQFVGDNARFLSDAINDLMKLVNIYEKNLSNINSKNYEDIIENARKAENEIDLQFLKDEIPKAISQSREGLSRVTEIVHAMKDFSYMGNTDEKTPTDINMAIESTITVARSEWKYVADIKTDLSPNLPLVPCYPGEIKQVLINLIINAANAISTAIGDSSDNKGTITITSYLNNGSVEISMSDTGMGIPKKIHDKIFDPFFTTKEIGAGTGQGLAISHASIVNRHGGTLTFETEEGKGATFKIVLPLKE
ncbi:sensor histidine kinase [Verrucomicrobiota bacterium]